MGEAVDISFFIKDIQNLPATNPTAPNVASVIIRASMRPAIIVAVDAERMLALITRLHPEK